MGLVHAWCDPPENSRAGPLIPHLLYVSFLCFMDSGRHLDQITKAVAEKASSIDLVE